MYGLDLPHLTAGNHHIESEATPRYNCVSHAVYEDLIRLWPDDDGRWPVTICRQETIDAFAALFIAMEFREIGLADTEYEPGFEKVALFADGGLPLHVARQLRDGRWTSKLGGLADINHEALRCLEGGEYGYVVKLFKRRDLGRPTVPPVRPPRPLIILP